MQSAKNIIWVIQNVFSKYDVYTETGSIYCYKGSNVLCNRFGIRDFDTLKKVETEYTTAKLVYLAGHPIPGKFTVTHLCKIHQYLFGDIYRFAGHLRKETIRKGSTTFVNEKDIRPKLSALLSELKAEIYLSELEFDAFIKRICYYLSELNYIHPFREGNGRAIREFMRLLISRNGYDVDWSKASTENLLNAMIDSVYDTASIENVLKICISACRQMTY